MRSQGLFCKIPGAMDQRFRLGAVEDSAAEDPRSVQHGVQCVDLSALALPLAKEKLMAA